MSQKYVHQTSIVLKDMSWFTSNLNPWKQIKDRLYTNAYDFPKLYHSPVTNKVKNLDGTT